jgi:MFS family permease
MTKPAAPEPKASWRTLPRNVWAVSLTSFFMDISSEMVINLVPLFLYNVLGVSAGIIGLIEGIAEATASLLKVFSGWLSDRLGERKWLAVAGYGLSALAKPFFYVASAWTTVAAVRWVDRLGKGIRTAPRDALVADSVDAKQRGLAFGFHRAADTGGAVVGLLIALGVVWFPRCWLCSRWLWERRMCRSPVDASDRPSPSNSWAGPSWYSWLSLACSIWATRRTPF